METEAKDTAMASPSSSCGNGSNDSFRLSEIENAHLCPGGRLKMEELFRQWLNVEGTKEMIQTLVEDVRQGKDLSAEVFGASAAASSPSHGLDSPLRSPKRPPNYMPLGGSASPTSSPLLHGRKKPQLVNLFGEELTLSGEDKAATTGDVVMKEAESSDAGEAKPPKCAIPRFYVPGEGRRGRLRGMSISTVERKKVGHFVLFVVRL